MRRGVGCITAAVLLAVPAWAQPSLRVSVVNLEMGDLRERLEETVVFSLDFAGLDYELLLLRPAHPSDAIAPLLAARPDLVVTIGSAGPRLATHLPAGLPVIAAGVGHPALFRVGRALFAGTSHYVPPARQLALFRKLAPRLRRLGVLADPQDDDAQRLLDETRAEAPALGITIVEHRSGEVAPAAAAERLLPEVDAILLLGGRRIAERVPEVLAVAARRRRPVFAYSEDLVRRGAVVALYADRLALAQEVGPMAKRLLAREGIPRDPAIQMVPIFKIAVNLRSARDLGLRFPYTLLLIANEIVR